MPMYPSLTWLCAAVQNIDTDQIIPAEYLTLVPSKVRRHKKRQPARPGCTP